MSGRSTTNRQVMQARHPDACCGIPLRPIQGDVSGNAAYSLLIDNADGERHGQQQ